tara:strand:+ start:1292 stop:1564 length:273 start_codon:yes stop_codon:yes gene_type:complete
VDAPIGGALVTVPKRDTWEDDMGPLYIKAKHKDAKRYSRMGRGIGGFDMIVTNVIFCVFYPEEDIERVRELIEEFRSLNPDYRFKLARRK